MNSIRAAQRHLSSAALVAVLCLFSGVLLAQVGAPAPISDTRRLHTALVTAGVLTGTGGTTNGSCLLTGGAGCQMTGTIRPLVGASGGVVPAAAASATAGGSVPLKGQAGGVAATNGVGKNGGGVPITGGAGSAKNGAGATDGNGGDVVLLGGVRGGFTATTETQGSVLVGAPSIQSTRTTDFLAVGGGFEVDGTARLDGDVVLGSKCTGTVVASAVTCSGNAGTITDDGTDINLDTTRADITVTNTRIATTSVITVTTCSTRQADTALETEVVPGAGSAVFSIRNTGTANFTAAGLKICFVVLN